MRQLINYRVGAHDEQKLNDKCSLGWGSEKKRVFKLVLISCSAKVQDRADALGMRSRQQTE